MSEEPNEGNPHAVADWIAAMLASAALIVGLIALAWPKDASADTWCREWADGYQIGYCWSRTECDYIPPAMCPYPLDGETDGYMRGLKDGLKDGRDKK